MRTLATTKVRTHIRRVFVSPPIPTVQQNNTYMVMVVVATWMSCFVTYSERTCYLDVLHTIIVAPGSWQDWASNGEEVGVFVWCYCNIAGSGVKHNAVDVEVGH